MRADAERNRVRILAAATDAFAAEGLSVPVHEIARRAGVGTGTVSRHFPTKEALFQAIIAERTNALVAAADELERRDPAYALHEVFRLIVEEGAVNQAVADALAGTGVDLEAYGAGVFTMLERLLRAAQRAGTVRTDVEVADLKALCGACMSHEHVADDAGARERMLTLVLAGLAP